MWVRMNFYSFSFGYDENGFVGFYDFVNYWPLGFGYLEMSLITNYWLV
jgi:hypothetical protein